ncbi:transmembrane protein 51 [Xenopus laevis]|uniref:Transmembrane protein 51 n=2 Tax=Xenopus laevis TaxID=8355 RepID=A0A1L8FGB0_XENLA|nr:transmembrane protein 51 [Xenopus laevis]XP_018082369.1 transmembrane protein 51 [Xenopus laevis]XP_018082370.1 transmembrane protein 51 [Xenopus laevis]OCT70623.1 hypothetical protein XELAEV_18037547mg [Xenopus laevis]
MAQMKSSGSHYALTAIGAGMLVLGVVMAVWNLVPVSSTGNSSKPEVPTETNLKSKSFTVAYVLVGSGIAFLLIAICLSIRSRRKRRQSMEDTRIPHEEPNVAQANSESSELDIARYSAPSYDEVMRIGYETSNTRAPEDHDGIPMSLPSYESLTELDESAPTRPIAEPPQRTNSRSGKEKKPLNVRRIKSDKLHLKEFRLNLSGQTSKTTTTIEPLTPPPQYEEKPLDLTKPV